MNQDFRLYSLRSHDLPPPACSERPTRQCSPTPSSTANRRQLTFFNTFPPFSRLASFSKFVGGTGYVLFILFWTTFELSQLRLEHYNPFPNFAGFGGPAVSPAVTSWHHFGKSQFYAFGIFPLYYLLIFVKKTSFRVSSALFLTFALRRSYHTFANPAAASKFPPSYSNHFSRGNSVPLHGAVFVLDGFS